MNYVCLNGKILPANKPVLMADNRSYRYGDGLFETMKISSGKIILQQYHFERLFGGLKLLRIKIPSSFTKKKVVSDISALAKKNKCEKLARIRLSVSGGNGGLNDGGLKPEYLIECWPVDDGVNRMNKKGLNIDIFPGIQKNCDIYSNLKSANFLPYILAAKYAKKNKLDECLINNINGRIADATVANIFLVKNKLVITPALSEGCVNGTVRKYLVKKLAESNFDIREGVVTKNDLETFDEVFLTNAVYGIKWVKRFRDRIYTNGQTVKIYKEFIEPLYS